MGVNDIRAKIFQDRPKSSVSLKVSPRSDGTNQFRNLHDAKIWVGEFIEQGSFGTKTRASDQSHFVVVVADQVQAIKASIFLGSAYDHACDDMNNSHDRTPWI